MELVVSDLRSEGGVDRVELEHIVLALAVHERDVLHLADVLLGRERPALRPREELDDVVPQLLEVAEAALHLEHRRVLVGALDHVGRHRRVELRSATV